ncbi:hypothetical protein KAH55_13795, partial [bacterium]|nr:hypothetical protein [bacterium]
MKIRQNTLFFITLTLSLGGRLLLSEPSPSVQLLACDENKITVAYTFPPPAYDTIPVNGQLLEIPRIFELSNSGIPG